MTDVTTPPIVPYWTSPDGAIVVYNDRWENVVSAGLVPVREVALIHADPPYGTGQDFNRGGKVGVKRTRPAGSVRIAVPAGRVREFAPCAGDGEPFDPAPLLALDRPLVAWGSNHYGSRMPDSAAGILWDKRENLPPDDGSDGEYAWSNVGGSLRIFRHYWRGSIRKTEKVEPHVHINQKPIALSAYVFGEHAKLKRGALVFVPYMGSGPDLPAAVAMGLRVIACEVSEEHCRVAIAKRCGAVTAERAAQPAGPLFEGL